MGRIKYNSNNNVVIYPNEKGWAKIREILQKEYKFETAKELDEWLIKHTVNGGYKDQLWTIVADFNSMFFNGTSYFENSFIDLCGDINLKDITINVDTN